MTNASPSDSPAIELRGVHHRYDSSDVLHGIDLAIPEGEVFGFLGHNGSGKTTTVNILTTLIQPTSGSAHICGHDVTLEPMQVRRLIGYLPADVRLYDHMTALENLEFFARLSGVLKPREAAMETLDYLDSSDLARQRLGSFSTGMRQRVGIAQALLHKPRVLFLDEPSSGLDPSGVRHLRETIVRLNAELGMTIFMNTHQLSDVAKVCTSIGVLNHGELIYTDTIENTITRFPDETSLEDIYGRVEAGAQ